MTHIYYQIQPIYHIFDLKEELKKYLLDEYQYIININNEKSDNKNDSWEEIFNDALLRLGNYLLNKSI